MTRLYNDPARFADEMIAGFAAANSRHVRAVPGGVVRATRSAQGGVAVVIGGGSGHYPAFGGLVGPGLAHGAAMGNLFASPATQQVVSVSKTVERGGGVLLCYGNYAGDVLNFAAAQDRLRADGLDCRTVAVTDDISSAPTEERHRRRGIAGDLVVFKVAGAAAEAGASLDDVERIARHANDRTRSLGVAFAGCTLPGANAPLFDVPVGRMAIGLGIHGEPGIGETAVPSADELGALFVSTLLAELPDGVATPAGARVAVVLNGLGSVKYEELYVVYREIDRLLRAAGVVIVEPEVGEFCTSFDMAGASLTLFWLDEELERLWAAPADSSAFRKAGVARETVDVVDVGAEVAATVAIPRASATSRSAARRAGEALAALAAVIDAHADDLGQLDAVAGDGDHGIGMQRGALAGSTAARAAVLAGAGAGSTLQRAGDAWSERAGGTSGALWGVMLGTLGTVLGDEHDVTPPILARGIRAAVDAVRSAGGAAPGDKTMVDALEPFATTFADRAASGEGLATSWSAAAVAARAAAATTADLLPRLGRARPHAERSLGTPDPGAHSFALAVSAVSALFTERDER